MDSNVVQLVPESIGEGYRFDPNKILTEAMENNKFAFVAVVGETEEGEIYLASSGNLGETIILMDAAKMKFVKDVFNG